MASPRQQSEANERRSTDPAPVTTDDGSAVWTIPLQISIRLGHPVGQPATRGEIHPTGPAQLVRAPAALPKETQDLREALAELAEAGSRTYYDEGRDRENRRAYYQALPGTFEKPDLGPAEFFRWLNKRLEETHDTPLTYRPSRYVYPWVDLHPDGKLRSIYSGRAFDPADFIQADFRIDQERERFFGQFQELTLVEPLLGAVQLGRVQDLLEAVLPYNCEHVVPQSWFGKRKPMRGDLHHLFACEVGCNSFRGNTPYFDFPDFAQAVRNDCGKVLQEEHKFEPEAGKGAVARATLYFLLRYPGEINQTPKEYRVDRLEILLSWHKSDRVTDYERHRNLAIFEKQGNRNPLIDFPEWATLIDFRLGLG